MNLRSGQFITGRKALEAATGIEQSKCERLLKLFKTTQQIEQQKTNKFRIITICNWDKYQDIEQQNEQQVNNNRTTSEQQVNTNKKDKKVKNVKKEHIAFELPEWIKPETWEAFKEMRQRKRAPLIDHAAILIVKNLEKLKLLGNDPNEVLNESIMKSWTGVFPLSKGGNGDGTRTFSGPGASFTSQGRGKNVDPGGLGIPREYKPEARPDVSEEERQRNLKKIRELTR